MKRGFTLIELLVVVAIIMILAATILAALGGARKRAVDARIKSTLWEVKNQAELYYTTHNNFGGYYYTYVGSTEASCSGWYGGLFNPNNNDSPFNLLKDAAYLAGGGTWNHSDAWCYIGSNGQSWAALVHLKDGNYWCVDSDGVSKEVSGPYSGGVINSTGGNTGQFSCGV